MFNKKIIAVVLAVVLILTGFSTTSLVTVYAKKKMPILSKKKITITVGKAKKVTLKNSNQKVQWTVTDKKIAKIKKKSRKYNRTVVIKGLKSGTTKIIAKCGKKKYIVKVTVTKKTDFNTMSITESGMNTVDETTQIAESKFIAKVLNDGLTTDDALLIQCYFDKPTDVILGVDDNPQKLEIYEDGQWKELEVSEDRESKIGGKTISWVRPAVLSIPLENSYKNIKPGHYRYTHSMGTHHTYQGKNPYGNSITVEFDVTCPEIYITAEVKAPIIKNTEDLEITYTIVTRNDKTYTYSTEPYDLIAWNSGDLGYRTNLAPRFPIVNREYQTATGSGSINLVLPLDKYFGLLSSGKYKYVHKIAGKDVKVFFQVDSTEE